MSNFERLLSAVVFLLVIAVASLFFLNFSQEKSLKNLPLLSSNSGQTSDGKQSDTEMTTISKVDKILFRFWQLMYTIRIS